MKKDNVVHFTMVTLEQMDFYIEKLTVNVALGRITEQACPNAILVLSSNGFLSGGILG